jgi:inhibitor of cysteine peptidase
MAETVLTEADSGGSAVVRRGDRLVVRLPENPTTGYLWAVDQPHAGLALADSRFTAGGAAPGAAGVREIVFSADRAGEGEVGLKEWREWEGDGSVTRRFSARITVE